MLAQLLKAFFIFYSLQVIAQPLQITFWHSMAGKLGQELGSIISEFNQQQDHYKIIPSYKGTYNESLVSTVAAFRASIAPDLVQLFDIATGTLIKPQGAILPVQQLYETTKRHLATETLLPLVKQYYSDKDGKLLAVPFNVSTGVLFYNKTLLKHYGLSDKPLLGTWEDVSILLQQLRDRGASCGLTSTWPAWIHVESFCVRHGLPFLNPENGFNQGTAKAVFHQNKLLQYHIEQISYWKNDGRFRYGGRVDDAQTLFTSQQCVMLTQSSGALADLAKHVPFEIGVAPLPYWQIHGGQEHGQLIGGGAIWVMANIEPEKYVGITEFLSFLLSAPIQARWQQKTGYLAVLSPKYLSDYKCQAQCSDSLRSLEALQQSLQNYISSPFYYGIRLGNYMQVREVLDQQLEQIWSKKVSTKQALSYAAQESNHLLSRFSNNTSLSCEEKSP